MMRVDELRSIRYFFLMIGAFCLCVGLGLPDSNVAQAQQPERSNKGLDLTGNYVINAADASMVAEAWQTMMEEEGSCELASQTSHSLFAQRDIDGNHCLSVVDVQKVLAHWGQAADASKPLASLRRRSAASGGVFVVNVASDESDSNPGDGTCQTANGDCTLRAAIEEANVSTGSQTINFDIRNSDGSCPDLVTINPASTLVVDDNNYEGTTIDGYTQCGASPNTNDVVGNAQIKIEIQGNGINNQHGMELKSPYHLIKGLAIYNFDPQLHLSSAASHNRIQGNFLGTNAANTFVQWGDYTEGLHLRWGASYNIIGCGEYQSNIYQPCQTQAEFNAARNIVGGANGDGITIQGDIMHTRFIGNYVGVAQDGTTALRNSSDGIDFGNGPQNNWVGGTLAGERNVVSGNRGDGIELSHSTDTQANNIVGNYVGVDATGNQMLANKGNGVTLEDTVDGTQVYDNVISGNEANGIRVYMLVTNVQIYDNLIGVAADGVTPMGNGSDEQSTDGQAGIYVMGESQHINIYRNVIAYNPQQGIHLSNRSDYPSGFGKTYYNTISQNSIHHNGTSGIYLNPKEDPDTGLLMYPNDNISAPTITSATQNSVSGTACANCTVELFIADKSSANDPSGENNGEGETYLASTSADGNGNFTLSIANLLEGQVLTATATDNLGNSSSFARNVAVTDGTAPTPVPTVATTPSPTPTFTPTPTATATPALDGSLRLEILNWADDAEERLSDGKTYRGSSDLELIEDSGSNGEQIVGLRYQNATIPQGATITRAYLELTADETQSETTALTIRAEASDNAERIRYQVNNLSTRSTTNAALEWQNVPAWTLVHETQQTPDFPAVIQEIVNRPGWVSGNALVLLLTGSGHRTAESYDGSPDLAPVLHVEYTLAGPDLPPTLPTSTPEPIPAYEEGDITIEPLLWIPVILR